MDNKLILDWLIPFSLDDLSRFDFTGSDMQANLGMCKGNYSFIKEYFLDKKYNIYVYWIDKIDSERAQLTIY